MHILVLSKSFEGSQPEVRLKRPLNAWAEKYDEHVRFCNFSQATLLLLDWADIVMISRHLTPVVVDLVHAANVLGKKVIYDVDDNFFNLPTHLKHHRAGLSAYAQMAEALTPYVDCVLTSSQRLSHLFEPMTDRLHVIPNCVSVDNMQLAQPYAPYAQVSLLLAATDLMPIHYVSSALKRVQASYGDSVSVTVIGPNAQLVRAQGVRIIEKEVLNYTAFHTYIRTLTNPIGLIPLDASDFSACKTPVKFLDYTIAGIPVICSNVPPFSDLFTAHEQVIMSDNAVEKWVDNIQYLIDHPKVRESIVLSAQACVSEHYSMEQTTASYQLLFLKLMQAKDNLPTMSWFNRAKVKMNFYIKHLLNIESYFVVLHKLKSKLMAR